MVQSCYLYVIGASESGPVKLGLSNEPEVRLRKLQTGSPDTLRLFHVKEVDARFVKSFEKLLHRDMSHFRRRGEWFGLTVEEAVRQIEFTIIRYENELEEAAFWRDI